VPPEQENQPVDGSPAKLVSNPMESSVRMMHTVEAPSFPRPARQLLAP
jgi:hypothetical protein